MEKEMLTVKEWAKKSGLKLYNYDGFLSTYEKLSQTSPETMLEHVEERFRDAGEMLCSRESFETHLSECTMEIPKMEELDSIAEVIPHFVENFLNLRLSTTIGMVRHGMIAKDQMEKELTDVLQTIGMKLNARAKSLAMYKLEDTNLNRINDDDLKRDVDRILQKKVQTVEEAELMLCQAIAREIEVAIKENNITIPRTLISKLRVLTSLFYHTARSRKVYSLSNDFMLVSSPLQKKEDLIVPYNMIGESGIHSGVAFDLNNGNVHAHGTLPISEDAKEKLEEDLRQKQL